MTTSAQAEYDARRALERQRKRNRTTRTDRDTIPGPTMAEAVAEKITGQPCRLCERDGVTQVWDVEAHHIVHRGRIGSRHPLVNAAANVMPVCHVHHQDHHTTTRRIPRSVLLPSELQFALEHAGAAWVDRWYPEATA